MNKICTSLEQSKKLLELGIDINTADIYYTTFYGKVDKDLPMPKEVYDILKYPINEDKCIPAWSLSALLDLLPKHIQVPPSLKQSKYMYNYHNGIVEFGDDYHKEKSTNLFDAAFKMVCWLKENNKI